MAFVFLRIMHDAVDEIIEILFKAPKTDIERASIDELVRQILQVHSIGTTYTSYAATTIAATTTTTSSFIQPYSIH